MFKRLSEDILFLLIKNKLLDIKGYDIYLYSIEIIILNGSLLLSCFTISFFVGNLKQFAAFLLFFIPLRMLIGGYHCKTSERCFMCSVGMYLLSLAGSELMQRINIIYIITQIIVVFMIGVVIKYAPLINNNHPLETYQIARNKKIVYGIIAIDFVLNVVLNFINSRIAASEIVFIALAEVTFVLGLVKEKNEKSEDLRT